MMEAQKDAGGGFELQTTSAQNQERRKSIPAEPPKVPQNNGSVKGPPKPSKSSTLPNNNTPGKTTVTVENGNGRPANTTSGTKEGFLSMNVGFFQSWQAVLKIIKFVCFASMLIAFCIAVNGITRALPKTHRYAVIWESVKTLQFGIGLAVIGLIVEVLAFFYYLCGLNIAANKALKSILLPLVFIVCHAVMFVFVFVAPIVLNAKKWTGPAVTSFIAFDLITLAGYAMELYFNVIWIAGGPELACLPCF